MYQICQRVKNFFSNAFHFAAQAIPIILLIDNKASKLEQVQLVPLHFNHFER